MLNMLNSIIRNTEEGTLKHEVAEILIDQLVGTNDDSEILAYMHDIVNHGCVSGIVTSLITYNDTEKYFDKHANKIFDLMNEKRDDGWDLNNIEFSKNNLAWWSFEVVTSEILYELEEAYEMM